MAESLHTYQLQFAAHLRNPQVSKRPAGIAAKRMQVYVEIVFNNIESTLAACFPVIKKILGKRQWLKLVRRFFSQHVCSTPIFREIPREFVNYLQKQEDIAPWISSLAHYEWVELAVSVMPDTKYAADIEPVGDLLTNRLVFTSALMMVAYDYPVHKFSPSYKPEVRLELPIHFLVFRNTRDDVRFIELNAASASLVATLLNMEAVAANVLAEMAASMGMQTELAHSFGLELLQMLKAEEVILGVKSAA